MPARHMFDAAVRQPNPFDQTGVLLLDNPAAWCPLAMLPEFFQLLNDLFPQFQFLIALPARPGQVGTVLPGDLATQGHPIPEFSPSPPKSRVRRVPAGTIVLIDVDSSLPNLALMKLSRHFKEQGKRVVLAAGPLTGRGGSVRQLRVRVFQFSPAGGQTPRVLRL